MNPSLLEQLTNRQAELLAALSQPVDMRPGSLVQRYRVCGKPGCHCAQPGSRGHGPIWSLTREVAGKTVTKIIPASAVELTTAQIAAYRRFRATVRELVETCERLCDERLAQAVAGSQEAAKKGASKRSSARKSSRRSTSS
jgi:hypothetical protein